jgi:hypothetical protein
MPGAMMRLQSSGPIARTIEINPDHPDDLDLDFGRRSFGHRGIFV